MEPNETILVSGKIIAEFEDDASLPLFEYPEFLGALEATAPTIPPVPIVNDGGHGKPS